MNPAHLPHYLRQFDHFLHRREVSRHIKQAGGHAERAIPHRLRREFLHLPDLFGRRPAIREAEHLRANAALSHEGRVVDRDGRLADPLEKRRERHGRVAVGTFDDCGYAFAEIIFGGRDVEDPAAAVGMDVDKPGRNRQAAGIQLHGCRGVRKQTHRGDAFAFDPDIRVKPRAAGTVDDFGPCDQDVERAGLCGEGAEGKGRESNTVHHIHYCPRYVARTGMRRFSILIGVLVNP